MRIKEMRYRDRRDFVALFECEHCGHVREIRGYDDSNFHVNVIPKMVCEKCGESAREDYRPLPPKYADDEEI